MHRLLVFFLGVLALSSCAGRQGVAPASLATSIANEGALVLPPPGGPAIVSIVERRYNNAVQQEIFLFTSATTPGQNYLKVAFFGPVGRERDSPNRLRFARINDVAVAHELRREFPGIAMAQSPYYAQNNYGGFNYAVGRARGGHDTCLYAWQQIQSPERRRSALENQGVIQLRLRLCETGATEEKLLSVMYNYTISGSFQSARWNPYGDPPPADARLGVTGHPMVPPLDQALETPVRGKSDTISSPVATRRLAEADDGRPVVTRQPLATDGVIVPSPIADTGDTPAIIVPSPTCSQQAIGTASCP